MRLLLVLVLLASFLVPSVASPPPASAAAGCQFVFGFKTMHDLLPNVIGDCTTNESSNPISGDSYQSTTKGVLVWRKSDGILAFTDGYRTWLKGPTGLVSRLNSERFPWERDLQDIRVDSSGFGQNGTSLGFSVMVTNPNESYAIENAGLEVTGYDAAGKAQFKQAGVIRLLLPLQKRAVSSLVDLPAGVTIARIEAKPATGKYTASAPEDTFRAEKLAVQPGSPLTRVTADVVSPFPKGITAIYVGAVAYDAAGRIIGGGGTYLLDGVPANGRAPVTVDVAASSPPARVELYPAVTGASRIQ